MKLLSMAEAQQAIDDLFDLEIQTIPLNRPMSKKFKYEMEYMEKSCP